MSDKQSVFKVRDNETGKYWHAGSYKWSKKGCTYQSEAKARNAKETYFYGRHKGRFQIVEFELLEVKKEL